MTRLPTLFISHGAPTLPIDPSMPSAEFASLRDALRTSAFDTDAVRTLGHGAAGGEHRRRSRRPSTISTAFRARFTRSSIRAPGAPELGKQAATLLTSAGIPSAITEHGLDHGAWVPLLLMFPDAEDAGRATVDPAASGPGAPLSRRPRAARAEGRRRDDRRLRARSRTICATADFSARPEDADPRVTEFTDWFEDRSWPRTISKRCSTIGDRRRTPC